MREQFPTSAVHISGDTLALDQDLRARLQAEASRLQGRYPETPIQLRVKIAEEFDQRHGHRVRCELVAATGERQQIVVREAQKDPLAAIANAFASAKRQLRRLSLRRPRLSLVPAAQIQPTRA
jgi:ribosome-associated translation inhibitor RaiA